MFRSVLSCASIFVLVLTTLFSPAVVSARRCGERLPVTLLSLYRSSEFIYIGTFDRIEEGEVTEETEDYRVIPVKKYFSLSSALKGETKKMLVLEESEYRFKENVAVDEVAAGSAESGNEETTSDAASEVEETEVVEEEEVEEEVDENELKPGDRVLLFLTKEEESGELELTDSIDGAKKMTPERLSAYEPRIRELNQIFSRSEPSYTELVAWMVRCAEDPHTRWEGTYELLRSFQAMDWQAEQAKQEENKPEPQDGSTEVIHFGRARPVDKFDTGDENFAKALTEGEKLLLTSMLLSRERPKQNPHGSSSDDTDMIRGDRELIELVKRWGDSKVARNLIEQLRYDSSDSNFNSDLMSSIASIMDDEELSELASQYSDVQWQDESDSIEEEKEDEAETETETDQSAAPEVTDVFILKQPIATEEPQSTEQISEITDESDAAGSNAGSVKVQSKKKTYGELRAELLTSFLARADRLIADKNKAEENH